MKSRGKKKNTETPFVISLQDVTKVYSVHHEKPTFVETVFKRGQSEMFTALESISLEIKAGEKVGLIGRNGSGKTTLIKTIAGISTPTFGRVSVTGKVVSLIDVTAGFHADLSGYENIYLNGLVIGMTKHEVRNKIESIVKFADIGDFISAPLHTYSEGMKLRLGISVALHAEPDILLLDEVIVAGDADFQKKSMKAVNSLVKSKTTLIMVSHWMAFLKEHCERFIYVKDGRIVGDGGAEVLEMYGKLK